MKTIEQVKLDQIEGQSKRRRHKKQGGFTLIELMVVVVVVGSLMALLMPNIMNPSSQTDSLLLERISNSTWSSYSMVTMTCGASRTVEDNPLIEASSTVEDLVFTGEHNTTYKECYERSGVTPNSGDVTVTATGDFMADGKYPVTILDSSDGTGGVRAFEITFADVPTSTAQNWFDKFREGGDVETVADAQVTGSSNERLPISATCSGGVCEMTRRFLW
jgi:prepilin-type N-terminal cleavage/methylation domain-containing protein